MVSLPVSRHTNSSTICVKFLFATHPFCDSARISTIIGTITSIQPERMVENVPSKSKSATRAAAAVTPL